MAKKQFLDLTSKEKRDIEQAILKRIEEIIFNTKRPSGMAKVDGGYYIVSQTGELKRKLKANKGFMRIEKKGFVFDIRMMSYYKFLDDQRRDDLNWYLTEAIYNDDEIMSKIKEVTQEGIKAKFLEIIAEEKKQIES